MVDVFTVFRLIGRRAFAQPIDVGFGAARLLIRGSIDLSLSDRFIAGRSPVDDDDVPIKLAQRRLRRSPYRS